MTRENIRSSGSKWLRGLLTALLVATCIRVWLGPTELTPRAAAQIPDSGRQRQEMLQTARETNRLLNQILTTLKSGPLNVRVIGTDKKDGGPIAPPPTGR
ncbi:MAG: hypothetical protein GY778_12205 [bacterium]|nr:hypothetical protein [bacterium]